MKTSEPISFWPISPQSSQERLANKAATTSLCATWCLLSGPDIVSNIAIRLRTLSLKRNEEFQKTRCHHCNSCTVRLKCIEFSIDGNVHFPFATSNIIKPVKTCKNKPWSWILLGERTLVRCQHHCLARIKCSQSELLGNGVILSFKTLQGLYHARLRPNKAQDSLSWQQLVSCQRWKIEQHQVLS